MEYLLLMLLGNDNNTNTVYIDPPPKPIPMGITGAREGQSINDLGMPDCNN